MLRVLTATALLSPLLLGCVAIRDRQERAADFVEGAAKDIQEGMERAKEVGEDLTVALSGASKKVQATVTEMEQRAVDALGGVKTMGKAVHELKEGAKELKGAVDIGE